MTGVAQPCKTNAAYLPDPLLVHFVGPNYPTRCSTVKIERGLSPPSDGPLGCPIVTELDLVLRGVRSL